MTAALCILVLAWLPQAASETPLQGAVRLTAEERFVEALKLARTDDDALFRAQGELFVLQRAGALDEALSAGLRGLEVAPKDPWLLERCANLALSLGSGGLAQGLLDELVQSVGPLEQERLAPLLTAARGLVQGRQAKTAALARARAVLLGIAALLALAALLGRDFAGRALTLRRQRAAARG